MGFSQSFSQIYRKLQTVGKKVERWRWEAFMKMAFYLMWCCVL